ncbi:MAG TPA: PQQ-dependent sugar dehydrogenase, partial [Thermoanaerobaculia bacterium]
MRRSRFAVLVLLLVTEAAADMLPGFRLEKTGDCEGFLTSIAFDPAGNLHYSTTNGGIHRLLGHESREIARVETANEGNAALLGIAFRSSDEVIAHYVAPDLTADIIASIALSTREVLEVRRFVCDDGRPCSSEHHGGNPIVAPDGSIYVGIGDIAGGTPAQIPTSPAGKILRIAPDDSFSVYALGFRNPYDLAVHAESGQLIVGDNGAIGEDEINLVAENDNGGWPYTMGSKDQVKGMLRPAYTFDESIAPTGLAAVNGQGFFKDGFLVGSFVTRAVYYFPKVTSPLDPPIVVLENPPELSTSGLGAMHAPPSVRSPIIDVVQDPKGDIYIGTAS